MRKASWLRASLPVPSLDCAAAPLTLQKVAITVGLREPGTAKALRGSRGANFGKWCKALYSRRGTQSVARTHARTHVDTDICLHLDIHLHIHALIYTYIYVYIYVYRYTSTFTGVIYIHTLASTFFIHTYT